MAETENRNTHKVYEKDKIGEVQIADEVVAIIAGLAATEVDGVDSMADLSLNIKYGFSIPEVCEKVQDKVKSAIENMTGLTVLDVNIKIAGVSMEETR